MYKTMVVLNDFSTFIVVLVSPTLESGKIIIPLLRHQSKNSERLFVNAAEINLKGYSFENAFILFVISPFIMEITLTEYFPLGLFVIIKTNIHPSGVI